MFQSEPLMTAIHADRLRDLERRSREQRLLQADPVEWTDVTSVTRASLDAPIESPIHRAPSLPRTSRSTGSACEAV